MRRLLAVVVLAFSPCALAGEIWLQWDPPAVEHPGLDGYRVEVDLNVPAEPPANETPFEADMVYVTTGTAQIVTGLECKRHCLRVISTAGPLESAPSNVVCGVPTVETDLPFPGVIAGRGWCWYDVPVQPPTLRRVDVETVPG